MKADAELDIKLTKDMRKAASTLTAREARYLVDSYYQMQGERKRAGNQISSLTKSGEPHATLEWLSTNSGALEKQIAGALSAYAESQHMGQWSMSIRGIGPIIAAGLLAHLRIDHWSCAAAKESMETKPCNPDAPCSPECHMVRNETVGHWWRFAGLDPSSKWDKGGKRPWNTALKTLCFNLGECFIRAGRGPDNPYAELYYQRKEYEQRKNEAGEYKELALQIAKDRPTHAQAKTYKAGKLPDGHIHSRCRRYMVKQFLSDYFMEAYRFETGKEAPLPYPISILGHAHLRTPAIAIAAEAKREPVVTKRKKKNLSHDAGEDQRYSASQAISENRMACASHP
jgi:hypothetical protein